MESSKCALPLSVNSDSANGAWKRCSLEMVNLISKSTGPPLIRDYNNILLENRDLKKQYKMTIAALNSAISENSDVKVGCSCLESKEKNRKDDKTLNNIEKEIDLITRATRDVSVEEETCERKKESDSNSNSVVKVEDTFGKNSNTSDSKESAAAFNFKAIKKKFDVPSEKLPISTVCSNKDGQKPVEFICLNCANRKSESLVSKKVQQTSNDDPTEKQTLELDVFMLKRELEKAYEEKNYLKNESHSIKKENVELRNQVLSLELSLKTLTEAINLQDEQLTEYGSVVTSLKNSRSAILEKLKEANSRNHYNIMIMENIEREAVNLRRQLDAYNELLVNRNIQLIDKASSTEGTLNEENSYEEIMKKKDNYINLLQDRLCEAIVDLKVKDSEIKNHANSVKALINNYEAEKKILEERLKFANVSTEKLEEHKIKQQETMKQLMKLIEFLQEKLEKVNKK